jgi:hypothetical protein
MLKLSLIQEINHIATFRSSTRAITPIIMYDGVTVLHNSQKGALIPQRDSEIPIPFPGHNLALHIIMTEPINLLARLLDPAAIGRFGAQAALSYFYVIPI